MTKNLLILSILSMPLSAVTLLSYEARFSNSLPRTQSVGAEQAEKSKCM